MSTVNQMEKKEAYMPCLDILRFIFAILVVSIHFAPFGDSQKYETYNFVVHEYFSRIAVPGFFIISSYFIFIKCDFSFLKKRNEKFSLKRVFDKCKHYLFLYFIWTLIYSFWIYKSFEHGRKTLIIILRDTIFCGSYLHLWFFPAIILAIVLVSFLLVLKIKPAIIVAISFVFYLFGLLGQSYHNLIYYLPNKEKINDIFNMYYKIFYTTRNGLFEAFLFVALGMLLAYSRKENKKSIINMPIKWNICLIVLFFMIQVIEANMVRKYRWAYENDFYLSTAFLTLFLVNICLNGTVNRKFSISENKAFALRKLSGLVFYTHLLVFVVVKDVATLLHINVLLKLNTFLVVLFGSLIVSAVILWLSNTKQFKFLKKIY